MGPLQQGLPSPTPIPQDWPLVIIDLKDCFFTIPLHPDNAPCFDFSVPSINMAEPSKQYHWTVLPQGMKNSPTICQWYVARALSPVRVSFSDCLLYHYMDDILLAAPTGSQLEEVLTATIKALTAVHLVIATEKVQKMAPWQYLGWRIAERTVAPSSLQISLQDPE